MTSPPNTTGWNSARRNFTNFAQTNSSHPTSTLLKEETTTPPTANNRSEGEMQVSLERSPRDEYYSTHYSAQTGLRIALTLGSFFLFVLLTLLYKSKCKKHSSRSPSPELLLGPPPIALLNSTGSGPPGDFLHHQVHPYSRSNSHPNSYDYCPNPNYDSGGGGGGPTIIPLPHPALLLTSANSDSSDEDLSSKPLCPLGNAAVTRYLQSSGGGRPSIDIHVILPTPTISPSNSSEHFRAEPGPSTHPQPLPPLLHHHPQQHYYYLNDRRRSSASSSNTTWTGGAATSPFTGTPFTFPDNLKYVDDTSSDGARDGLEDEEDQASIGSDSVFASCEPPPPPLPPRGGGSRRPSMSPSYYSGLVEDQEWRVTLSQAAAQVHHRDSFASDLESVNDYLEGISSGGGGGSGANSRRRSSSTQTTLSDLQHCLGIATATAGGGGMRSPSPRLSPHPLPHHFMSLRQSPVQFLAAPTPGGGGGMSPRVKGGRKRSVDALLLGRREQHSHQMLQLQQRLSGPTTPAQRRHACQQQEDFGPDEADT